MRVGRSEVVDRYIARGNAVVAPRRRLERPRFSASALTDVDRLAWIGVATFSTRCERNPASAAAAEAPRMTVLHDAATPANRRGHITHRRLTSPKAHLSRAARPRAKRLIFSDRDTITQGGRLRAIIFFEMCCPNATATDIPMLTHRQQLISTHMECSPV
jgi:hypothetical protein